MCSVGELASSPCRYATVFHPTGFPLKLPVALTFVLAPLPNAVFAHCGADDFSTDGEGSGPVDLGRFITAMVVVTGFALPLVLAHSGVIHPTACVMSIIGGAYVHSLCTSAHYCASIFTDSVLQPCVWNDIVLYRCV